MWRVSPDQRSGFSISSGALNWYSVRAGTTLMPSPARTMPATVASWSTSSTAGSTSGSVAASMYWRTLEVRDRWMKGQAATSLGRGLSTLASGWSRRQTRWKPSVQKGSARSSAVSARVAAKAKSACPLRTCSMQASDSTSATWNSMPGCAARKPASTAGSQSAASEGSSAIDTRPRPRVARSCMPPSAASNSASTRRADCSNSSPSLVRFTWRVLRSNRRTASASSS